MALLAGVKPTVYNSVLTGLSKTIYDDQISNNIISSESAITSTIGDTTYTESTTNQRARILKAKLDAFVLASSVLTHLTTNGVVSVTVTTTGTAAAQTGTGSGTIA